MPIRTQFATEAEWLEHLRLYFAGQALAGLLANDNLEGGQFDEISKAAFAMADAMLAARTPTHRRD